MKIAVVLLSIFLLTICTSEAQIKAKEDLYRKTSFSLYDTVKIVFIGDIMQHGVQIKRALKSTRNPTLPESYDYSATFHYVEKYFKEAELTVANMEFPIGDYPYGAYPNFKAPVSIARQAKQSGIGLFLLANNHLGDQGQRGFAKTLAIYDTLGVPYMGAYLSEQEKMKKEPVIISIDGIKIGFINFTYGSNVRIAEPHIMNYMDSTAIKSAVSKTKAMGADIIIALPHWGNEYQLFPSEMQKRWAKMLFWHGCDAIVGTHPHVPQSAEIYMDESQNGIIDKAVFYSLGNFVSNQSNPDYTQIELLVKLPLLKNTITGKICMGMPEYEFLWCFKAGEFDTNYTAVPISDILGKRERIKDKQQYDRMLKTYKYILSKQLIRIMNQ